ncbi:uncharacterized protein LOC134847956 isoform X2 [Symsagittifera roscoffensis]|uniref:uncharacterized protein LOC134847956 isoform X2 n=1 Tax=Symsagittifera roscoffensis TaxID=84072 RepID=UPI00307BBEE5
MMAMGSLSVEISVNYPQNYPYLSLQPHAMSIPFGDNTNTQSCLTPTHPHEQYLEMVLGSLHPECQMDQLHNPYSVGAMFRCRKCESRLSSYGGLRTHLKTCSGCTNVVAHDGALKINELPKSANHNFHSLESQKVVPTINDLSKLQPTFEIDSKSCPRADSNSGAKNETLNSDIKQGFDPLNKADVVVFDTNNNEEIEEPAVEKLGASMMRVKTDNIPVYIKKPQRPEDMFHLVNKPALLTKKRVKPPPKQSSKNKKSKICAQPSLAVKLTSQSKNTFLLDNDPKTGSTSENVDDSSSNVRPKRLSKSAVSYEEKIADIFLETSSPHSSPKQQRESRRVSLRSESSAVNEPQEQVKSAVITNSEGSTRSSIPVNGANTTDKKSAIIHVNPKAEVDSNKIESNIGSSQPRDNLVLCKHCEQRHAKRYMIVHMRNEHPDLPFCCPVCYSAFASVEAFKVHKTRCRNGFKRIQDRSRSVSVRRPESEGTNGASCGVKCKECNEEFFNSNSGRMGLIRHIKEQHRAKFVCRFCFFFTDNGHIGQLHNCKGPPSRVQVLQQPQTEEDQDALTTLKPRASQETVEIGQLLENHVDAVSSSGHSHDHSVGAREEGVEDVSRTPLQEIGVFHLIFYGFCNQEQSQNVNPRNQSRNEWNIF